MLKKENSKNTSPNFLTILASNRFLLYKNHEFFGTLYYFVVIFRRFGDIPGKTMSPTWRPRGVPPGKTPWGRNSRDSGLTFNMAITACINFILKVKPGSGESLPQGVFPDCLEIRNPQPPPPSHLCHQPRAKPAGPVDPASTEPAPRRSALAELVRAGSGAGSASQGLRFGVSSD